MSDKSYSHQEVIALAHSIVDGREKMEQEMEMNTKVEEKVNRIKDDIITALKNDGNYHETTQERWQKFGSLAFTGLRAFITLTIVLIFAVVDFVMLCRVGPWLSQVDIDTINITSVKYIVIFLTFQLIIFSQGFGFSSVVKLIAAISNAIRGKKTND
jgi:hypothetical protein